MLFSNPCRCGNGALTHKGFDMEHGMRFSFPRYFSDQSKADFLRRLARRMLRDAHSDQPSAALPVVRRVHAAGILPQARLSGLYHARAGLQLKHMLRTLAAELGYACWADCKRDIERQPAAVLDRFRVDLGAFGDFNQVWFADQDAALRWQRENGGHLVAYGRQAVVMTA